jgi:transcriptional regulator with XRE-family HTH domain
MNGQQLRFFRRLRDVSQADLARQLKTSQTQISLIERGRAPLTDEQLRTAWRVLRVPLPLQEKLP